MQCTGVQRNCSSNVHGGEDDSTGLRALTADITPLMRCVPRATPNMRRRGNCKSAGTGSRQAPRSCLRRDWNRLLQAGFRRGLRALCLRGTRCFAGFRVFRFFFARGAAAGVGGIAAPARTGSVRKENKSPAASKNALQMNFFTAIPPENLKNLTLLQPSRGSEFPNRTEIMRALGKKNGRHADRAARFFPKCAHHFRAIGNSDPRLD